jgi:hypothetical protein
VHVFGESDDSVVPAKRTNKTGPKAVAESVEERESAKGNAARVPFSVSETGQYSSGNCLIRFFRQVSCEHGLVMIMG